MGKSKLVAGLISVLVISGCMAAYKEPSASLPSSTIEFAAEFGTSFDVVASPSCESRERIASFNSSVGLLSRRVPAGRPFLLVALTTFGENVRPGDSSTGFGADMKASECRALIQFVPEAGHTYAVEQAVDDFEKAECTAKITDKATEAAPPGVSINEAFRCPLK